MKKIKITNEEEFMEIFHEMYSIDYVCGQLSQRFQDEIMVAPLEAAENNSILEFVDGQFVGNNEHIELLIPYDKIIEIFKSRIWIYG